MYTKISYSNSVKIFFLLILTASLVVTNIFSYISLTNKEKTSVKGDEASSQSDSNKSTQQINEEEKYLDEIDKLLTELIAKNNDIQNRYDFFQLFIDHKSTKIFLGFIKILAQNG